MYPCVANGANEKANLLFRQGKIGFLEIGEYVKRTVDEAKFSGAYSLEDVLAADEWARNTVESYINNWFYRWYNEF